MGVPEAEKEKGLKFFCRSNVSKLPKFDIKYESTPPRISINFKKKKSQRDSYLETKEKQKILKTSRKKLFVT